MDLELRRAHSEYVSGGTSEVEFLGLLNARGFHPLFEYEPCSCNPSWAYRCPRCVGNGWTTQTIVGWEKVEGTCGAASRRRKS